MLYPMAIVRAIIPDEQGRVLILKRQQTGHSAGAWCLPGGKVQYNETIEQALEKELSEETSLTCTEAEYLFYQDSLPSKPGDMHCINFYFRCSVTGEVALNDESCDFAWVGEEEIGDYDIVFRNDLALLRYWEEQA